jgi:DtxR family transcriptional regulator, Mn-dependent transcriptional regulator
MEDFLKSVHSIAGDNWADITEIAGKSGIKQSTIRTSLGKLVQLGLVEGKNQQEKVRLTSTGLKIARGVSYKHSMIKKFLSDFLCVNDDVAENDAHHIEHIISDESLMKMVSLLEYIEDEPEDFNSWFSSFRRMIYPA